MVAVISPTASVRLISAIVSATGMQSEEIEPSRNDTAPVRLDAVDADLRVPAQRAVQLWGEAVRATGDRHIGFRAGTRVLTGAFGVVDYAARCGATLREFYLRFTRYRRLIGDSLDMRFLERGDAIRIAFDFSLDDVEARRQMNEFFAAALVALGREATGQRWMPERLAFRHQAAAADPTLHAWLGAEPGYGEPVCSIQIPHRLLVLPLTRAEPGLAAMLDRLAQDMLARLPEPDDLPLRVRYAISSQLWTGECSLEAVARMLCMSPRSLQRRLQDCETSFNALVDNTRREAALELILDLEMTVSDIAVRIGFSEPSAFDRAFRRWTGCSPGHYRRTLGPLRSRPSTVS